MVGNEIVISGGKNMRVNEVKEMKEILAKENEE